MYICRIMVYKEYIERVQKLTGHLYGSEEGRAIAVRLLQHFCGISAYEHLVEPYGAIAPELLDLLESAAQQAAAARPLQYIIGYQEFMGLKIQVEEGVLIPRPETEGLVLCVLEYINTLNLHSKEITQTKEGSIRILDAATGSGCIAAVLANKLNPGGARQLDPKGSRQLNPGGAYQLNLGEALQIYAFDLSLKALEIASHNLHEAVKSQQSSGSRELLSSVPGTTYSEGSITLFQYNLLNSPNAFPYNEFDIIVSNPPYVLEGECTLMRANVLDYEPAEALFVPDEDPLCFYYALERLASFALKPNGAIFMEINENLAEESAAIFKKAEYCSVEILKDLFGKKRFVKSIRS